MNQDSEIISLIIVARILGINCFPGNMIGEGLLYDFNSNNIDHIQMHYDEADYDVEDGREDRYWDSVGFVIEIGQVLIYRNMKGVEIVNNSHRNFDLFNIPFIQLNNFFYTYVGAGGYYPPTGQGYTVLSRHKNTINIQGGVIE